VKRTITIWLVSFVMTLAFLVWQKLSGPTYEVKFDERVAGAVVEGELLRTHSINGDMPVTVLAPDESVTGEVIWRRFPTEDAFETLPLVRDGKVLRAELPRQGMAGKLEYHVELHKDGQTVRVPDDENAVARYKGDVPSLILVFHVTAMVLGMFFSTGCGMSALFGAGGLRLQSRLTFLFLLIGGLILGPIVQKYAFDAYWTGWPLGGDWTDNKLAVGALVWLVAAWRCGGARPGRPAGRWWAVLAMLTIFVIYGIPHSIHGSTLDYETGEHIQALLLVPLAAGALRRGRS
jgi:hypothetical protein